VLTGLAAAVVGLGAGCGVSGSNSQGGDAGVTDATASSSSGGSPGGSSGSGSGSSSGRDAAFDDAMDAAAGDAANCTSLLFGCPIDAGSDVVIADAETGPDGECGALNDPNNCGACGVRCCGALPVCAFGGGKYSCVGDCPSAAPTMCFLDSGPGPDGCSGSGICVATSIDSCNCGACGIACEGGTVCVSATCVAVEGGSGCTP
jgi:hypothetical protein